jgi:hypothetical protein
MRMQLPEPQRSQLLRKYPTPATDLVECVLRTGHRGQCAERCACRLEQQQTEFLRLQQEALSPPALYRRQVPLMTAPYAKADRPVSSSSGIDFDRSHARSTLLPPAPQRRPDTADMGDSLVAESRFILPSGDPFSVPPRAMRPERDRAFAAAAPAPQPPQPAVDPVRVSCAARRECLTTRCRPRCRRRRARPGRLRR